MKAIGRWLLLLVIAVLGLQLFFVLRIALMAVVDPQCRVIGMEGLRVADSSIMPRVTNGNLNGPTLMIGEKASDHILGIDPLPPSNQEAWVNPNWETSQR
jgi:choline dehydrogenase